MKKEIEKLMQSNISAYQIARKTGVAASSIQRIRSGERTIGKLTLDNAEKLYAYQKELECNDETKTDL